MMCDQGLVLDVNLEAHASCLKHEVLSVMLSCWHRAPPPPFPVPVLVTDNTEVWIPGRRQRQRQTSSPSKMVKGTLLIDAKEGSDKALKKTSPVDPKLNNADLVQFLVAPTVI